MPEFQNAFMNMWICRSMESTNAQKEEWTSPCRHEKLEELTPKQRNRDLMKPETWHRSALRHSHFPPAPSRFITSDFPWLTSTKLSDWNCRSWWLTSQKSTRFSQSHSHLTHRICNKLSFRKMSLDFKDFSQGSTCWWMTEILVSRHVIKCSVSSLIHFLTKTSIASDHFLEINNFINLIQSQIGSVGAIDNEITINVPLIFFWPTTWTW